MKKTLIEEKRLIKSVAEDFGFGFLDDNGTLEISFYTNAGQDFSFNLYPTEEGYMPSLDTFIEYFDPDYEATLWTDGCGHGVAGAPYRLKDIILDMEDAISLVSKFRKALIG